eukprot:scaffold4772_cov153-Amphora_coffeaeformis.AAC.5
MCAITALPTSTTCLSNRTTKYLTDKETGGVLSKQPPHERRRRVSFADASQNRVYRNTQWSKGRARKQWYTAQEFRSMKEENLVAAKRIHKKSQQSSTSYDHHYTHLILRIYDACAAAQNEEGNELIISTEYQSLLPQAFSTASYRMGLEKTFIRRIALDKKYRRQEVAQRVLRVQEYGLGADRPALMRLASMSVSRASRLFAHQMAWGLAASIV